MNSISVSADYRLDPLGHLPSPFNIKCDGPLDCKRLTTETDIAEPFPPVHTSLFRTKAFPPAPMSCQSLSIPGTRQDPIVKSLETQSQMTSMQRTRLT
jgi:hypothetical protein